MILQPPSYRPSPAIHLALHRETPAELSDRLIADSLCPTCGGSGDIVETHEGYACEVLGCPHCYGSGKKWGTA